MRFWPTDPATGLAVQAALETVLKIPPDDYFRIVHVLPPQRFIHTRSFLGLNYNDDFILLEVTFISGRPKETRLAFLKELNERVVAAVGISPDDLSILLLRSARRKRAVRPRARTARTYFDGGLTAP